MKLLFALVLSLSAPLVCAQTVYTWVDDNGVLHMSDTPNNGAKTVKLPDLEASAPLLKWNQPNHSINRQSWSKRNRKANSKRRYLLH